MVSRIEHQAMEKLVGDKVRAIGVSNFGLKNLDKLLKTAKIVPAVNQVMYANCYHFCLFRELDWTLFSLKGWGTSTFSSIWVVELLQQA